MLHHSAKELLGQLDKVVAQCKEEDFSRPLEELSFSTFGQHVRHTLEFFICLFDAKNGSAINYDKRRHDSEIETDKKLAKSVISSIVSFIDTNTIDFEVYLEANYTASKGKDQKMKSSFFRELAYNVEHTIHHLALMKVAVNQTLTYIDLPENFGVASSTVRYRLGQKT